MAQWAYLQRTRGNVEEILNADKKLIFWFGGQLKSEKEIHFHEDRAKNLLQANAEKSAAMEEQILSLMDTQSYSASKRDIIRKNICMEINRAHAMLKLLESYTPGRKVFDIGAGCGIINYIFRHDFYNMKDIISCDQIAFSRDSFFELHNLLSESNKKYLYQEEMFTYTDHTLEDILLFRWSFDEFDEISKERTLALISKNKFKNIAICGNKHSNKKIDIDRFLISQAYIPVFAGRKPFDHGLIRIYERQDKSSTLLLWLFTLVRLIPDKRNRWTQLLLQSWTPN